MASTVNEGFDQFIKRLTPTAAEREKAASYRATIEAKLDAKFGLSRMFQSGSFSHGTGSAGIAMSIILLPSSQANRTCPAAPLPRCAMH